MTDAEFLAAFRAQAISQSDWTHRAHVRAAYLHLCEMPIENAMGAMREGIKKLNASHGLVETPERGYHETLTRAWLTVIGATIRSRGRAETFEAFAAAHPHLLCSTLLRVFYSPKGMPPEARYSFVEPDLTALPSPQ
jgi:hypothetical protein